MWAFIAVPASLPQKGLRGGHEGEAALAAAAAACGGAEAPLHTPGAVQEVQGLWERARQQAEAHAKRLAAEQQRQQDARAPAQKLADVLLGRGWRIGRPQFGIGGCWFVPLSEQLRQSQCARGECVGGLHRGVRLDRQGVLWPQHCRRSCVTFVAAPPDCAGDLKPSVDTEGLAHWPVLLFYPEASMQHDTIQDFSEEDTFRCMH